MGDNSLTPYQYQLTAEFVALSSTIIFIGGTSLTSVLAATTPNVAMPLRCSFTIAL